MYTIFSHDIPIYLTDNLKNKSENNFFRYNKDAISSILKKTQNGEFDAIFLYHPDIKGLWKNFKNYFKIEKAAGGFIKNEKDETLFIFRLNRWDLPKGKIEKGESKKQAAIREVKEECGLKDVIIEKKLPTTYHIFLRNGRETLKITQWYLMKTDFKGTLVPQIEEDIIAVVFKNEVDTEKALRNTYGNIKLLFHHLKNN